MRYPANGTGKEVFRANVRETLLQEIISGNSIEDAAALPGMPSARQMKIWLSGDKTLRQDMIEALKITIFTEMTKVVDIADGVDGSDNIARDRLRVNTRLKIAEKLLPEIYGQKTVVEAGDSLLDLINPTDVTPEAGPSTTPGLSTNPGLALPARVK